MTVTITIYIYIFIKLSDKTQTQTFACILQIFFAEIVENTEILVCWYMYIKCPKRKNCI